MLWLYLFDSINSVTVLKDLAQEKFDSALDIILNAKSRFASFELQFRTKQALR